MIDSARFQGRVDGHNDMEIVGWAMDTDNPDASILVEVSDETGESSLAYANIFRQDLLDNGLASGNHGFRLPMPRLTGESKTLTVRFLDNRNVIPGGTIYLDATSALLTTRMPEPYVQAMQVLAAKMRSQFSKSVEK